MDHGGRKSGGPCRYPQYNTDAIDRLPQINRFNSGTPVPPVSNGYSSAARPGPSHSIPCPTARSPGQQSQLEVIPEEGAGPIGCGFCRVNCEDEVQWTSHSFRDSAGTLTCPVLRSYVCPVCGGTGDMAHIIQFCPGKKEHCEWLHRRRHWPTNADDRPSASRRPSNVDDHPFASGSGRPYNKRGRYQ